MIEAGGMGEWAQFFSILAGPLGSLFLLLFCRFMPRIAVFGLIQGAYNLIPVLPLDGGRLLQLLLLLLCPEKADTIMEITAVLVGILVFLLAAWSYVSLSAWIFPCLMMLLIRIGAELKKNSLQTATNRGTIG